MIFKSFFAVYMVGCLVILCSSYHFSCFNNFQFVLILSLSNVSLLRRRILRFFWFLLNTILPRVRHRFRLFYAFFSHSLHSNACYWCNGFHFIVAPVSAIVVAVALFIYIFIRDRFACMRIIFL